MDKNFQDIINFWGDSLKKVDTELIKGCSLSVETKELLLNIGLPLNNDVLINFNDSDDIKEYTLEDNKFVTIGDDFGTQIGIHESTSEIYSFDDANELPQRFVNSDIKKLLQFLMIYIDNQSELVEATDDDALVIVNKIREKYNKIDSRALDNDKNWWSVILEQTEKGLM